MKTLLQSEVLHFRLGIGGGKRRETQKNFFFSFEKAPSIERQGN